MKTGRYNLKELLTHNEIEQIIIPEIQRDYVWQKDNVSKLIRSILFHFGKKEKKQLKFQIDGDSIENIGIVKFLQHEYDRLIYNLKLGFIYAYHDNEYAGKFFLIDGQQRITTLYLLLLCLYKKAKKQDDFGSLYFKNNQLKVDYKVREDSHDFMVQFVKNQLSETIIDIREIQKYYTEYDSDITIQNIIANYNCIEDLLPAEIAPKKLLSFVEEFVEVNYFDTNLSQQGEQLYLYMNSRGESLSFQELIKAEIIKKEPNPKKKKEFGKLWEDWQNFFWEHRFKNENADIGFQEFLKWASIIQICNTAIEENIEFKDILVDEKFRRQSFQQAKENYIHQNPSRLLEQQQMLSNYQITSPTFNCDYLSGIFNALKYLYSSELVYIPVNEKWLSGNISTVDYIVLCPLLHFVSKFNWEGKPNQKDLERLAMFLNNLTHFRSSLAKNPDSTTIYSIEMANELCFAGVADLTFFLDNELLMTKYKTILSESELYKLQILRNQDDNQYAVVKRDEIEKFIWDITLNDNISKFLEGDISILFDCINFECPDLKEQLIFSTDHLNQLKNYYLVLNNVIFNLKNNDLLRRALLTFGDYTVYYSQGSYYFGPWIGRYSFIQNDEEWRKVFKDKKNNIVLEFMQTMKPHVNTAIEVILEGFCNDYTIGDWKQPFIRNENLLKYCWNKKILRENDSRIILLSSIKAGSACEIQTKLLSLKFKTECNRHNSCLVHFSIENGQWIDHKFDWNLKDVYALDIKFENNEWEFTVVFRNKDTAVSKLEMFDSAEGWELVKKDDAKAIRINKLSYDLTKSILENVDLAYQEVQGLKIELADLFESSLVEII